MAAGNALTPARYGILIAGQPDQRCCESKGDFAQMFLRLLRDEGCAEEEWSLFRAFQGQLPSEEELRSLRGLVITGSVADAFGDDDWLVGLRACVKQAVQLEKRVLGVCFGHQLVGVTLGARVGRAGCWEVGAREVEVSHAGRAAVAAEGGAWAEQLPERLCLLEFHQDQVLEVPAGATLLASSERCPVEMFSVGSHVLCIQGHPEFDSEVVRLLAEPRLGLIGEADVQRMEATLAWLPVQRDAPRLRQLCKAFLKG